MFWDKAINGAIVGILHVVSERLVHCGRIYEPVVADTAVLHLNCWSRRITAVAVLNANGSRRLCCEPGNSLLLLGNVLRRGEPASLSV
jgi:hypothetical protein